MIGTSGHHGRLGLVGISFLTVMGACTAAASILNSSGVGGGGDLTGFGGGASQETCIDSQAIDVSTSRPVDVIFVIDDSGSMTEELELIENNINEHFAEVMDKAGLDYRVIMIVAHGGAGFTLYNSVCIEAPLSTIPKGGCEKLSGGSPPGNNPGKFYHYSYDVQSNDSLCIILDTLFATNNRPDQYGLATDGWMKWLRKSAFKIFIEVTDDMSACTWYPDQNSSKGKKLFNDYNSSLGGQITALEWDKALLKLSPEQFGTKDQRNYAFYSIVGLLEKPNAVDSDNGIAIDPFGKPEDLFTPSEGIVDDICSIAVAAGQSYQWLSKMTGGLRYPVCQAAEFDVVFEKIASSIDSITSTVCTVEIPTGETIGAVDVSTVQVEVETIDGEIISLHPVAGQAFCTGTNDEFYYDKVSNTVMLCPETCIESKSIAKEVRMTAGCITRVD